MQLLEELRESARDYGSDIPAPRNSVHARLYNTLDDYKSGITSPGNDQAQSITASLDNVYSILSGKAKESRRWFRRVNMLEKALGSEESGEGLLGSLDKALREGYITKSYANKTLECLQGMMNTAMRDNKSFKRALASSIREKKSRWELKADNYFERVENTMKDVHSYGLDLTDDLPVIQEAPEPSSPRIGWYYRKPLDLSCRLSGKAWKHIDRWMAGKDYSSFIPRILGLSRQPVLLRDSGFITYLNHWQIRKYNKHNPIEQAPQENIFVTRYRNYWNATKKTAKKAGKLAAAASAAASLAIASLFTHGRNG